MFPKLLSLSRDAPASVYRSIRKMLTLYNHPELRYIIPGANWVTDWVGYYITTNIRRQFGWSAKTTSTPHLLVDHILHYGEAGAFLHSIGSRRNRVNTVIATIFHGDLKPEYPDLFTSTQRFLDHIQDLKRILVSCKIMEERLLGWGIEPEKVVRIPLGVDTAHFKPPAPEEKRRLRQKYRIPSNAVCIGSFQKDGVGWGDGLEPKMIKGPDVFLDVISRLRKDFRLHVLLSGPARGYVKRGLAQLDVPFTHLVMKNYLDIADLYACLDLYLVTSREEGGPKAVLESLASGVPIVSTRVGLAPDLIRHGKNGFLCQVDAVDDLADDASQVIANPDLRKNLIENGRRDILEFDWESIAAQYYFQLYCPLLPEHQSQTDSE